jgi:hypothetical protein
MRIKRGPSRISKLGKVHRHPKPRLPVKRAHRKAIGKTLREVFHEQEKPEKKENIIMPTKKKSDEGGEDSPELSGYSGSPAEGATPPERPKSASEDAVVSDVGVTEPTQVFKGDGLTQFGAESEPSTKASGDEVVVGNFVCTGKTFHGQERTMTINIPSPVTAEGVFHAFRSHYPDAIQEGFSFAPPQPV